MPQTIHLHDLEFQRFRPHEEILAAIHKMATQMNEDFKEEKPVFLVVLKGAFMFAAELIKEVQRDVDIEFIRIKSYEGTDNSGGISKGFEEKLDVKDRTVVILEDIVDTGNTLEYLHQELLRRGAKAVKCATLFFKPEAYKKTLPLDYVGLEIADKFVVGFGLDYDERGRGFKDLYQLANED